MLTPVEMMKLRQNQAEVHLFDIYCINFLKFLSKFFIRVKPPILYVSHLLTSKIKFCLPPPLVLNPRCEVGATIISNANYIRTLQIDDLKRRTQETT